MGPAVRGVPQEVNLDALKAGAADQEAAVFVCVCVLRLASTARLFALHPSINYVVLGHLQQNSCLFGACCMSPGPKVYSKEF